VLAHAGALFVRGIRLEGARSLTRAFFAPGVAVSAALAVQPGAFLVLSLGALFPMPRDRFGYGGPDGASVELFRPGGWAPRADVGLALSIP